MCENDFEGPVFAMRPEIAEARQSLQDAGASPARMSGSGSTVFGFFESKAAAAKAAKAMPDAVPFTTLSRREYREAWNPA